MSKRSAEQMTLSRTPAFPQSGWIPAFLQSRWMNVLCRADAFDYVEAVWWGEHGGSNKKIQTE